MAIVNKPGKISYRILIFIPLILLIVASLPLPVMADRSLSMESLFINAQILPDASMEVTERITVDFSGQWNGFYVIIPQDDTSITNISVSENGQAYKFNPSDDYGPPGTFLTKVQGNDILIDWSVDAYNQVRTFDVSYKISNGITIHNDVAELYRKFVGEANGNSIKNVRIYLRLPPGAEKYTQGKDIRIWGHGPLNGEVSFDKEDGVLWEITNLPPYTFLEGRVVMPTELFKDVPTKAYSNRTVLDEVLAEEQEWASMANKERRMAKTKMGVGAGIIAGAFVLSFLTWRRYGRKHEVAFDGDYYRDLPASYSPAELSVLWNFKKIKTQDLTATILDLARRKFLYLEEDTIQSRKILGTKEITTYRISFLPHPNPSELKIPDEAMLKSHEDELITYLQGVIGNGKDYIHLTDIENHAKKNGELFFNFWKGWSAGIVANTEKYNFFEDNNKVSVFTIVGAVALTSIGVMAIGKSDSVIGISTIIAGLILLLSSRFLRRRSAGGEEDYVRWSAFKRFLLHFSEMKHHEIPSLVVWEHYLVYAVTLGVAKEVIRQLEIVFPNMQEDDRRFGAGWMYYGSHGGMKNFYDSFDNIGSSFEKALGTAQKAASKASSGSGGGGGFSGGGGGGGGGGSYGGR